MPVDSLPITSQTPNPNWPLFDEAISFQNGPGSAAPFDYWCSVIGRSEGRWSATRGRQYELDQYQALNVTTTLQNNDAALDPANTASPFYPQVTLYRGYRRRAQFPATVNRLTADQATAFYASKGYESTSTLPPNVYQVGTSAPLTVTAGSGGAISNRYTIALPISCPTGNGMRIAGWSVVPGVTYTAQVNANLAASVTCSGWLSLRWFDASGNTITTTTVTCVLTTTATIFSVTSTAPSNAAGGEIRFTNATVPASAVNMLVRNVQVEVASAASSFTTPGTWYDLATGFVQSWPGTFSDGGLYAVVNPVVTDALGYLSQRALKSPAYMQALSMGPSFLYPLDEDQRASAANDLTDNYPACPIAWTGSHMYGGTGAPTVIQTLQFGKTLGVNGGSAGWTPNGFGGPVLAATTASGSPTVWTYQFLDLAAGGEAKAGPRTTGFTRVFAFYCPPNIAFAGNALTLSFMRGQVVPATSSYEIKAYAGYDGNGVFGHNDGVQGQALEIIFQDPSHTDTVLIDNRSDTTLSDGWHVVMFGGTLPTGPFVGWVDGVPMRVGLAGAPSIPLGSFVSDMLGADDFTYGPAGADYAFCAEFPWAFSNTDATDLYSVIRYAGSGSGTASSSTRFDDILGWGQWKGQSSVPNGTTGETTTYGPSSDLQAASTSQGTDVVSALQTVVDTENGAMFVAADGTITLTDRGQRYNQSPQCVLGEGATGAYRSNLCPNPSFEVDTGNWSGSTSTIARSTAQFYTGAASLAVTGTGASGFAITTVAAEIPVTPNAKYTLSAYCFATAAISVNAYPVAISWYDNTSTFISTSFCATQSKFGSTWTRFGVVATAPSNAAFARLQVVHGSLALTDTVYVDGVLFEQAGSVGDYFDGSTAATSAWAYAWTGTANESSSTMTAKEVPYLAVTPGFDSARVANDVQLTQPVYQTLTRKTDTTSIDTFGDITLQRTVNTLNGNEMTCAAQYLLDRYKEPLPRIDAVTVDLAATNAWWLLGLELGTCLRVMRRPPSPYPAVTFDGFIEQITHSIDDQGHATISFQLSSASGLQFWQLDSLAFGVLESTSYLGY